jgi:hypothetical protein
MIYCVCWALGKGSVLSCALRRPTGIVSVNVLMWRQAKWDCVWSCFRMCNWKKVYFRSLPISNRQYDDLLSKLNNKTQPHCRSSFYSGLKFEQEWFEVSGFSYILNIYLWYCLCLTGKGNWIFNETVKRMEDENFVSVTFIGKKLRLHVSTGIGTVFTTVKS